MDEQFTDFPALHALVMEGDPRGLQAAANLTPEEHQAYFDYQIAQGKGKGEFGRKDATLLGVPPEAAIAGGLAVVPRLAGAIPSMGDFNPGLRTAATAAVGAGAHMGIDSLPIPDSLKFVLHALTGHAQNKFGAKSAAPPNATEAEIKALQEKGMKIAPVSMPASAEEMSKPGKYPVRNSDAVPSNLTKEKSYSDTAQRVTQGGVQNDFKGTASIKKPANIFRVGSDQIDNGDFPSQQGGVTMKQPSNEIKVKVGAKGAKFEETDKGAKQLEELLDATHGKDRSNNPNGGPDKPTSKLKPLSNSKLSKGDMPPNVSFKRTEEDLRAAQTGKEGQLGGLRIPGKTPVNTENRHEHSHNVNIDYAPEYTDASVAAAQKRIAAKLDAAMKEAAEKKLKGKAS